MKKVRKFFNPADEFIIIQEFISFKGYVDCAIEYPEPPDGLIKLSNDEVLWVEVSAIYYNGIAASLNETPLGREGSSLETSYPFPNDIDLYVRFFIEEIIARIKKKDGNQNYKNFTTQYGKGTLLLYIDDPFISREIESLIIAFASRTKLDLMNFNAVYLYQRATSRGTIEKQHCYTSTLLLIDVINHC